MGSHVSTILVVGRFSLPWVAMWALAALLGPATVGFAADDLAEVRDQISSIWRGFDGIECRSIEQIEHQGDEHNSTKTIDFAWKVGGRSAPSYARESTAGISFFEERDDGSHRTSVHYFAMPPKAINQIIIAQPLNGPTHYGGMTFPGLWIFLPGDETVAAALNGGGTLANQGSRGQPRWTLTARLKDRAIECVLDEAHHFLPKEVEVKSETSRQMIRVDRFEQADGFWYPAEGVTMYTSAEMKSPTQVEARFWLDRVSINHSISPKKFEWTNFPADAEVIQRPGAATRYVGGKLARLKALGDHPRPRQQAPTAEPILVPAEADTYRSRLTMSTFLGIAVLAGGLGLFLKRLRV